MVEGQANSLVIELEWNSNKCSKFLSFAFVVIQFSLSLSLLSPTNLDRKKKIGFKCFGVYLIKKTVVLRDK